MYLHVHTQSKLYGQNEDKESVSHCGVPIVIAATKYDKFNEFDSELQKVSAQSHSVVGANKSKAALFSQL